VAFTVLFFVSMGLIRFIHPASAMDPIQIASAGVVASTNGAVEERLA
jgi:predicted Kef-type K+ transport protein